ncbi:MAG: DUF2934 domain-containing protein [Gammaproteobacteria bacterium]|nr:DUF2934 domain-containing protein [Gammaproteobacteria bacterium]
MAHGKKPTLTRKAFAARAPASPRPTKAKKPKCTPEERFRMIQEAAYLLAEKGGFEGDSIKYWYEAEKEIDAKLAGD